MQQSPFRILLVEDDHYIAKIIGIGMQTLGLVYHLDQAGSAEEGLELWDAQPYDIVLTDYNLRGKSGIKLIEELKRRGATIPTMLFTAYDAPQTRREAAMAHVDAFLTKPFLIDEFVTITRRLLSLREQAVGAPTSSF